TEAGAWAVVPPGWQGRLPEGVGRIDAPTPYVWIIGRTQTYGPADYPAVHKIQDTFGLTPLTYWGGLTPPVAVTIDSAIDTDTPPVHTPTSPRRGLRAGGFSATTSPPRGFCWITTPPPHLTDWSLIAQMRRLGLVAGARFADLDPGIRAALQDVPAVALQAMQL